MTTVTIKRKGKGKSDAITTAKYVLTFSALPDQHFGPMSFHETAQDLTVSALMTPLRAREAILDAYAYGTATCTIETW
jgi:hypothetical protein